MTDEVLARDADPTKDRSNFDRTSAWIIGIGSLVTVFAMAHHPTIGHAAVADAIEELARKRTLNEIVHGSLIALMVAIFAGFVGAARSFGWRLERIRAAVIAHGFGVVCLSGAALINGFAVARLAADFSGGTSAELESFRQLVRLCVEFNRVLANAGAAAISVAILFWSLALVSRRGAARAVAAVGLAVGLLPPLALAEGWMELDVTGMGVVVLAQAFWNLCFAAWMLRERATARTD